MRGLIAALLVLLWGAGQTVVQAQDPGLIYKPAEGDGRLILNPSGDGYTSETTAGFTWSDVQESEIPFHPLPQLDVEPINDVRTGAGGGHTDLVDNGNKETGFMFYDGENLIFRIRLAGQSTASKGYSVFFNTSFDLFGPQAENFTEDNPGFQFEVVLETGNGVRIYELDGDDVTQHVSLDIDEHFQKSISYDHVGGEPGFFYDWYVPVSEINSIPGYTFDANTSFRASMATITRAQSGISGTISDVLGIDDDNYRNPMQAIVEIIEASPPTTANELSDGGGFGNIVQETNVPSIIQPVTEVATEVNGSINEEDGTVYVYKNGSLIGTTSIVNYQWSLDTSGIELNIGDEITARAQSGSKDFSDFSSPATVLGEGGEFVCFSNETVTVETFANNSAITVEHVDLGTGEDGVPHPDNIFIRAYKAGTNEVIKTDAGELVEGVLVFDTGGGNNDWVYDTDQNHFFREHSVELTIFEAPEDYEATAGFTPACESPRLLRAATQNVDEQPNPPEITTATITTDTEVVEGTIPNSTDPDAPVILYRNDQSIGKENASSDNWSVNVSDITLNIGDIIYARVESTGSNETNLSEKSNQKTVEEPEIEPSNPPVIFGSYTTDDTLIEGSTSEGGGTEIQLYLNGIEESNQIADVATANTQGEWGVDISGVTLSVSDQLFATATAPGKSESDPSDPVTILAAAPGSPEVGSPITTFDNDITVSSVAEAGIISIYIDQAAIAFYDAEGGGSFAFDGSDPDLYLDKDLTEQVNNADFFNNEFYKGAEVQASLTPDGKAESELSAAVEVTGVESFLVEVVDPGTDKFAGTEFDVNVSARDGADGSGNIVTGFTGTVTFFSSRVPISDGYRVTADFVNGEITHTIKVDSGAEDAVLTVLNSNDPFTSGESDSITILNPDDVQLTGIDPDTKYRGEGEFEITLTGINFVSNSEVRFNGDNRTTTFVDSETLTATILESDLDENGDYEITVFSPPPQGTEEETDPQILSVVDPPAPVITDFSPKSGEQHATMDVTITGTGLIDNVSTIDFSGSGITVNDLSGNEDHTELVANISTGTTVGGSYDLTVTNTGPGGGSDTAGDPLFEVNAVDHDGFTFHTIASPQTAGEDFEITITAVQDDGSTYENFEGDVDLSASEGSVSPSTAGPFTDGVWTGDISVTNATTGVEITAGNAAEGTGQTGISDPFDVVSGSAAKYLVSVDNTSPEAGTTVNVTAQLADEHDNPVSEAGRTVEWSSTNGGSFAEATTDTDANGVAEVVFTTSGDVDTDHRITATDGSGVTGQSSPFSTTYPPPEQIAFITTERTITAGGTSDLITIELQDSGGTAVPATSNTTISLSSPSGSAVFRNANNTGDLSDDELIIPEGTESASFRYRDTNAGTHGITASHGTIDDATQNITVNHASLAEFLVEAGGGGDIATQNAGTGFQIQVTARDNYDNVVESFEGTVDLTTTSEFDEGQAETTPAFTNGTLTGFDVTLIQAGEDKNITAVNSEAGDDESGTSNSFTVEPAGIDQFAIVLPGREFTEGEGVTGTLTEQQAGSAFNIDIIAVDAYDNRVTSYDGEETFTFTGPSNAPDGTTPDYPENITFTDGQAQGESVTLYRAESVAITADDGTTTGISDDLTVNPADVTDFTVAGSTSMVAGTTNDLVITAGDNWGNTATGFDGDQNIILDGASDAPDATGPVVSDKDGTEVAFGNPATLTFAEGVAGVSGENNGRITLFAAETVNITATHTDTDPDIETSDALEVEVSAGDLNDFIWALNSPQTNAQTFTETNTITAVDSWQNVITDYDASANPVTVTPTGDLSEGNISGLSGENDDELNLESDFTNGVADLTDSGVAYTGEAGSGNLQAGHDGVSSSAALTIEHGELTQLSVSTQPEGGPSGEELAVQPVIELQDISGNVVSSDNSTEVNVSIFSGDGGTLSGTTAVTVANGVVTYSDLALSGTVGENYVLRFSGGGFDVDSENVTVTTGAAETMAMQTQPVESTAGEYIAGAPAVIITDGAGNPVNGVDVTVSLNQASFSSGTTSQTTGADGIATFADLQITVADTGYELEFDADAAGVANVTSDAFDVTPESISVTSDGSVLSGSNLERVADGDEAATITVQLRDEYGNDISRAGEEVTFSTDLGDLSTTDPVATNGSGLASVTLTSTTTGTADVTAEITDPATGVVTNGSPLQVTFNAGALQNFLVEAEGGGTISEQTAGESFDIRITARDANNNTVTDFTGTVDISVNQNALQTGAGTTSAFTAGELSIHSLQINTADTGYEVTATHTGETETGTSAGFDVVANTATQLAITTQPTGGTGSADGTATGVGDIILETRDAFDNPSTSGLAGEQNVTAALENDPSGEATLGGTKTLDIQSGAVTFSDLTLDQDGDGFTITLSSSSPVNLGDVTTDGFTMDQVQDASGFDVALALAGDKTAGENFDLSITNGTDASGDDLDGSINVTITSDEEDPSEIFNGAVTFSDGDATIADVNLENATDHTLTIDVDEVSSDGNLAVTIIAADADHFVFTSQSGTEWTAGEVNQITINAHDEFDNPATGYDGSEELTFGGAAALNGNEPTAEGVDFGDPTSIVFTEGEATDIDVVLKAAETANLTATDGTVSEDEALDITVDAAAISVAADGSLLSGSDLTRVADGTEEATITVQLRDEFGNEIAQENADVEFSTSLGTLSETGAVPTNTDGLATVTLTSTDTGTADVTAEITDPAEGTVTNGSPVEVQFNAGDATQISSFTIADAEIDLDGSTTVTATILDAHNNPVEGVEVSFTSDETDRATVATPETTNEDGQATVTVSGADDTSGEVVITASIDDAEANVAESASETVDLTVNPGAATQLTLSADPGGPVAGESTTITAAVTDANANPVSGEDVDFSITAGNGSFDGAFEGLATDGGGQVSVTYDTDATVETADIQGEFSADGAVNASIEIESVPGDPANYLVSSGNDTPATGSDITITAQLADANDNAISVDNHTVGWSATNGGSFAEATSGTDEDGMATVTFTVSGDAATEHEITATDQDYGSVTGSTTVNTAAGDPDRVVFTSTEQTVEAGTNSADLTIALRDSEGNPAIAGSGGVTFDLSNNGAGQFRNTGDEDQITTVTIAEDESTASFRFYSEEAGTRTLTVTDQDGAGVGDAEQDITIEAAAANDGESELAVADNELTADGEALTTVTVTLRDTFGNELDEGGDDVFITTTAGELSGGDEGASGTEIAANDQGDGTYTATLTSSTDIETAEITAYLGTSDTDPQIGQESVEFTAGDATQLAFEQQPTETVAGESISPAVTVSLRDAHDNLVEDSGTDIELSITGTTSATLSGTTTQATDDGIATFANVNIDEVGSYTLTAESGQLDSEESDSIDITAGTPHEILITQQPLETIAGQSVAGAPEVRVRDDQGNNLEDVEVSVALSSDSFTGSSTTEVDTDADGLAEFSNLFIETADEDYTLTFNVSGVTGLESAEFDVLPAAVDPANAGTILEVTEDYQTADGSEEASVRVTLLDGFDNPVPDVVVAFNTTGDAEFTNSTESGSTNADGQLSATMTNATAEQVDVSVLYDDDGDGTADAGGVNDSPVTVTFTSGEAENLAIESGNNQTGTVDQTLGDPLVVKVTDSEGNPVQNESVSFSITDAPEDAKNQELQNVNATTDTDGLATAELRLGTLIGAYEVTVSSAGLTDVEFTATAESADPDQYLLTFSEETPTAGDAITVTARLADEFGNPVEDEGREIDWSATNGGTFSDEQDTDASGEATATFTTNTTVGTEHQITATDNADGSINGLGTVTTSGGDATQLVITMPGETFEAGTGNTDSPEDQQAGSAFDIEIRATDANFNVDTDFDGSTDLEWSGLADAPNGQSPDVPVSVNFSDGVAAAVSITAYLAGEDVQMTASEQGGISGVAGSEFDITSGELAEFVWDLTTPQTNAEDFTGTNTLTVRDEWENVVSGFDASANNVEISTLGDLHDGDISGLSGTTTLNSADDFENGVADLTELGIRYTGPAGNGELRSTSGGVQSDTALEIQPGAATQISLDGPGSVVAGSVSDAFTVTMLDVSGNTTTDNTARTFDLSSENSGSATFYSDDAGNSDITELTIADGTSTGTFYYSNNEVEDETTVTATDQDGSGLGSASHDIDVTDTGASQIALLGLADDMEAGTSTSFTLQIQDGDNNPVQGASDVIVNLSSDQTDGLFFIGEKSHDDDLSGDIDDITITQGDNNIEIWYYATSADNHELSIADDASALTGDSDEITVLPASLDDFVIAANEDGDDIGDQTAGDEFAIELTAIDAFENTVTGFNDSFNLTVNNSNFVTGFDDDFGDFENGSKSVTLNLRDANDQVSIAVTGGGESETSNEFEVNRRPIAIEAVAASKTYGDDDPDLSFELAAGSDLIPGDTELQGALSREAGDNVGTYAIRQGNVTNAENANYDITFTGDDFDITTRDLTLSNFQVDDKTFDGTTDYIGDVNFDDDRVAGDELEFDFDAVYSSADAGAVDVEISDITISGGSDQNNYNLVTTEATEAATINKAEPVISTWPAATDITYGETLAESGLSGGDVDVTGTFTFEDATIQPDAAGGYDADVTFTPDDDDNYEIVTGSEETTVTVTPKELTVINAEARDKTYDGNTDAEIEHAELSGVIGLDDVELTNATSGEFAQSDAGTSIAVTTNFGLSGDDAGNYELVQPTGLSADITPAQLTVINAEAQDKTYDSEDAAQITGAQLDGVLNGETVNLDDADEGTFDDANAGTGIAVTTNMSISGSDAGNYELVQPTGLSADITTAQLTVINAEAQDKTYEGNTDAEIESAELSGVIGLDDVELTNATSGEFAQSDAGTSIAVTTSFGLTGDDAGNYTISQPTGLSADINPAALTIIVNDAERVAGAADPTFSFEDFSAALAGSDEISDVTGGTGSADDVDFTLETTDENSSTGVYTDEIGIDVTSLDGSKEGNYDISIVLGTLTITPAELAGFEVSGISDPTTAGDENPVTVRAVDTEGNTKTDYTGTITFSSSDAEADLPVDYTFTTGDEGVVTLTDAVILKTAGDHWVEAADGDETGRQEAITVQSADAHSIVVSDDISNQTAGTGFDVDFTIQDAFENTVTGFIGQVDLSVEYGAVSPTEFEFVASDEGSKTVSLTLDESGEDQKISGELESDATVNGESNEFDVTAGVISATNSSVTVDPSELVVGNNSTVTISVRDANENLIGDLDENDFTLDLSGDAAIVAGTFEESSDGVYEIDITNETAEEITVTATVSGTQLNDEPKVEFTVGDVYADNSEISAEPDELIVGDNSTITVTLADEFENPVSGITDFNIDLDGATEMVAISETGQAGTYELEITNTTAETNTISVEANSTSIGSVDVTFTVDAISASESSVTVEPNELEVNNNSTVTITLRDGENNLISEIAEADFDLDLTGSATEVPDSFEETSEGVYTIDVTNETAEEITVTVTADGTELDDNPTITFESGAISASNSSVSATSPHTADGTDASTVTITLRDDQDNTISGQAGNITLSDVGDVSVGTVSEDGTSGTYEVELTNTTAEEITITANADGTELEDNPTITFQAGDAGHIAISDIDDPQTAGEAFNVTFTIEDEFSNRMENYTGTVKLIPDFGGISPDEITFEVSDAGEVTEALTLNEAGSNQQISAGDGADSSVNGTSNEFDVTSGNVTQLAFVQQPVDAVAGDEIAPAVTVRLLDGGGNEVDETGVDIILSISDGGTLEGTETRTTDEGVATFDDLYVIEPEANYTLTATSGTLGSDESDEFTITRRPITVAADDAGIVYGEDDPVLTAQLTQGQLISGVDLQGEPDREAGGDVGEYDITQGTVTNQENPSYDITFETGTFEITPRVLTISGFVAEDKIYDGTTSVTISDFEDDRIEDDDFNVDFDAGFADADAANNITVTINNFSLSGVDAGNYVVATTSATTEADITARELTIAGSFTAEDKTYDGTADAVIDNNSLELDGIVDGESVVLDNVSVEFADSEVGEDITVSITSADITGEDAYNYTLSLAGAPVTEADIIAADADELVIITQPEDTEAGEIVGGAPAVRAEDAAGNPVEDVEITVSINQHEVTTESITQITTDQNGLAEFADLIIETADTGYELTFRADDVDDVTSDPFDILPAGVDPLHALTQLEVVTDSVVADGTSQAEVRAALADAFGNPVPDEDVKFSVSGNGQPAEPDGTTGKDGVLIVTLTNTTAEQVEVTAVFGGNDIAIENGSPAEVAFIPGTVSSMESVVQADPDILKINKDSGITVELRDEKGNAITQLTDEDFDINLTGEATISEAISDEGGGNYRFSVTNEIAQAITVTVTADGITLEDQPEITFEHDFNELMLSGGDGQQAPTLATLDDELEVQILNTNEQPVSDIEVRFSIEDKPSGSESFEIHQETVFTDEEGLAGTAFTLGNQPGTYVVAAEAMGTGLDPVLFEAEALHAAPDPALIDSVNTVMFNGSTDAYIITDRAASFEIESSFTLETWLLPFSTDSENGEIVNNWSEGNGSDRRFKALLNNNTLELRVNQVNDDPVTLEVEDFFERREENGEGPGKLTNTQQESDYSWLHLAIVVDQDDQKVYLYKNGFRVATESLTGEVPASDQRITMGRGFDGEVHEVRYWNRAQSRSHIQAFKDFVLSGEEEGLLLYHLFDEYDDNDPDIALDNTNNENHFFLSEQVEKNFRPRNVTEVFMYQDEETIVTLSGASTSGSELASSIIELPDNGELYQVDNDIDRASRIRQTGEQLNDSGNRAVYIPDEHFVGIDSVRYELSDEFGNPAIGTQIIHVLEINRAPVLQSPEHLVIDQRDTVFVGLNSLVTDNFYDAGEMNWKLTGIGDNVLSNEGQPWQFSDQDSLVVELDEATNEVMITTTLRYHDKDIPVGLQVIDPEGLTDAGYFLVDVNFINSPPSSVSLISPQPVDTLHNTEVEFEWSRAMDLEGSDMSYDLNIIREDGRTIQHGGIEDTTITIRDDEFFRRDKSFKWEVTASDGIDNTVSEDLHDFHIELWYSLHQNYPNPFNPGTNIEFLLPEASDVRLVVYNVLGQRVATLVDEEDFKPGLHLVEWNAASLASGTYIYRLEAKSVDGNHRFVKTKKMTLVK